MAKVIAVLIRQLEGYRPVSMVLSCDPEDERNRNHTDTEHLHAKADRTREEFIVKFPEFTTAKWYTDIHQSNQD